MTSEGLRTQALAAIRVATSPTSERTVLGRVGEGHFLSSTVVQYSIVQYSV